MSPHFPAASSRLHGGSARLEAESWKLEAEMKLTDVIKRPVITEKTTLIREGNRTVVFEVAAGATKIDIKRDTVH